VPLDERGSVLALVPAAFLILIFLGCLAVDSAVAFQARSQLREVVAGAANDAVAAGIDQGAFYSSGTVELDPTAVASAVCQAVEAQDMTPFHDLSVSVSVRGLSVRVVASASVDAVFGRAIPGFGTRQVSASAVADLQAGPVQAAARSFPAPTPLSC
jgi:hypothetical protein